VVLCDVACLSVVGSAVVMSNSDSSVARFKYDDTLEVAYVSCLVALMVLDFGRVCTVRT
jgi:hypothetical protein